MFRAFPAVAVSLSGGGVRAAAYHAGVLRALHEAGFIPSIETRLGFPATTLIAAVSGGAISGLLWKKHCDLNAQLGEAWPEHSLLGLIGSLPWGGRFNWHIKGLASGASQAWRKHLDLWWGRIGGSTPGQAREDLILAIEMLDFASGEVWAYIDGSAQRCTPHALALEPSATYPMTEAEVLAAATAFPVYFRSSRLEAQDGEVRLIDAGLIDNLASYPATLPLISSEYRGELKLWFVADAGRPLSTELRLWDRVFRLTGDLAQPVYAKTLSLLLPRFCGVSAVGIRPDLLPSELWLKTRRLKNGHQISAIQTTLARLPLEDVVAVMAHGAAGTIEALQAGDMLPEEFCLSRTAADNLKKLLRAFYEELANEYG